MGDGNTKTVVPVEVVRIVPVAVGAADVLTIVVERPAAQDASRLDGPFTSGIITRR